MIRSLLRWIDPWLWRTPHQRLQHLSTFAHVERSSATDLQLAARLTPDPRRASLYLRHARDEHRHAQLFWQAANDIARAHQLPPPTQPNSACEGLFERLGEARFLAFVWLAEQRGKRQFEVHIETLRRAGHAELVQLLTTVVQDETHHAHYSEALLGELTSAAQARVLRRAAIRWELWRAFRRNGRWIAERLYALTMVLLYVACGPLRWLLPKPRPAVLRAPTQER